jgi:hypothetical protein
VPAEDPGLEEDLCDGLEFHSPWPRDFLDHVSQGSGDAQVYQQGLKPVGGDRSFSPKGLQLISICIYLLDLCVNQGRVLLVVLLFIVDVLVLLLLLLSGRTMGCWALRYHQLDLKRLLLQRYVMWCTVPWLMRLWHVPRCQLTNGEMIGALPCGAASMSHVSFREKSVR